MRLHAVTLAVVTGVASAAVVAGTAAASPYTFGPDLKVSGPSTLTACPFGASDQFASAYDNTEVEPQVAVNPVNPNQMVGATQQDRWPDGGARGLTSWNSLNGGTSWAKMPDVRWSACQGGPVRFGRVTDPWVSYDKGGRVYFIGQPIDSAELGLSSIAVTSGNGTSWDPPTTLIEDNGDRGVFNDKVSVTGDPTRAGYAYATWIRGDYPPGQRQSPVADLHSFAYRGQAMISRTTDGGRTWSRPVPMRNANAYYQGNQIAVAPDGTLYNVTAVLYTGAGIQPNLNGVYMGVMRSNDAGRTWTGPVHIAPIRTAQLFVPDDHFPIRAEDYLPDIAISPVNGDIYVVWSDGLGTPIDKVVLSKSSDGGRHFSDPQVVATGGPNVQSYNHAINVTDEWHRRPDLLGRPQQRHGRRHRHHRHLAAPLPQRHQHLGTRAAPARPLQPLPGTDLLLRPRPAPRPVPRRLHGTRNHPRRQRHQLLRLNHQRRSRRPLDPRQPSLTPQQAGRPTHLGRPQRRLASVPCSNA